MTRCITALCGVVRCALWTLTGISSCNER